MHALHCVYCLQRRKSERGKDESRIVISIDFKADLIDLFKGHKKSEREEMAKREEAVNLIREFPSNLMFKLLIILKERQRQKFSWKTLLGCWRGKTSLGGRKSSIKVIYFVVVSAPVFKRICSGKEDEETEAQKLLSRILARLQNSKRFEIFQLLLLRVNILCDMVNRLQKTSSLVNILSISRFI